jgi:hypothetical protein
MLLSNPDMPMIGLSRLPLLFLIVGNVACGEASKPPAETAETVTCTFNNATGTESCTTGGQTCEGNVSCSIKVKGFPGELLIWESSCGGQKKTTIDSKDESVEFDCALTNPVTEKVTCLFMGNTKSVSCTSLRGNCQGIVSCEATVTANSGAKLKWSSTCADGSLTDWSVVDGKSKAVTFHSCGSAKANETVTCIFKDSTAKNSCGSTSGSFNCSGVGSCSVKVSGISAEALTWKSASCGGYAYTLVDGVDENAEFSCGGK